MTVVVRTLALAALAAWATLAGSQSAPATIVYRCPGNIYTSNAELTPAQAEQRGCREIEGAPITVIQGPATRPAASAPPAARPPGARINPETQRERDSDARRILGEELRREEGRLAELKREYNNGEPERRGDERNYQRYLDRVAEMKAAIARKEADVAALKRELAKLPS